MGSSLPGGVRATTVRMAAKIADAIAELAEEIVVMELQLKGKVALVTGSTAGIGFAIGSSLAGEARQ